MATAANRSSLMAHLRRNRTSSPTQPEEFATATSQSFDAARDAIHSTAQIPDYTTEQNLPQYHYQHQYQDDMSENGSEGSAEMSIELGRGVKRAARQRDDDMSSNAVFQLDGGDSLYEVTGTPPIRSRNASARKNDDGLRRQASIRRATETAKTAGNAKRSTSLKQASLHDALNKVNSEDEASFTDEQPATATFNARNTRFSKSRQTSLHDQARVGSTQQTPRRGANNATAQSNSFVLPDLPNITELVSGVRKDGTPVFNRTAKSRSRFASGSYKPSRPEYNQIESVPVPDEEKAIYSSLQVLQARLAQLEDEKEDAERRVEEYEGEVIDLRSQLAASQGRPDSGLGSDDEISSQEKTKLRASIKSLQERLDRSERKFTHSEITCKRITNERDQLLQQIGVAYYNIEDLKQENEASQSKASKLQSENDALKEEVDELRNEIQGLRLLAQQTQASYEEDSMQRDRREQDLRRRLEKRTQMARDIKNTTRELWETQEQSSRRKSSATASKKTGRRPAADDHEEDEVREEPQYGDLESRVAEAVARARREALAQESEETSRRPRGTRPEQTTSRSRSKSAARPQTAGAERRASGHKRTTSAPQETELSENESNAQPTLSRKSDATRTKRASLPSPVKSKQPVTREEDERDITFLSWTDPMQFAKLRKKLEQERIEERMAEREAQRAVSAPAQRETTAQGASFPRKSSLRDVTGGFDEGTGRFSIASGNADDFAKVTKNVRVQSPHTSDEFSQQAQTQESEVGETSITSNISRRRRRAASAEGMTSAFILPDITLHGSKFHNATGGTSIQHDAKSCTACPAGKDATIPTPVPVTDREIDPDITNATIRPAEQPADALARVIKENEDEIKHLKSMLGSEQRMYAQHDPALSKRRRQEVREAIDKLTARIEKLSDQVYRLYDVLEGQKQAAKGVPGAAAPMSEEEVEETLESVGIDPGELAGKVGRKAPPLGLDGYDDDLSDEEELPGFSDGESVGNGDEDKLWGSRREREERRRSGIF